MTESIEAHHRTPRSQREANIDWMTWEKEPFWHSLSGALALIMGLIGVAVLTWLFVP